MNEEISLNQYPSVHWTKFFAKFDGIDSSPVEEWDATLLIAYFCKKYKTYYNEDYTFQFNSSAPGKSYEVFQIRKLSSMLSAKSNILKDYIDWFFETKLMIRKRRITSMAFLTDAGVVNEYKFKVLLLAKQVSISRATVVPPLYTVIIQKYGYAFTNYGELSFVKRCIDAGNGEQGHKDMLSELEKTGLDISALDRVK